MTFEELLTYAVEERKSEACYALLLAYSSLIGLHMNLGMVFEVSVEDVILDTLAWRLGLSRNDIKKIVEDQVISMLQEIRDEQSKASGKTLRTNIG